MLYALEFTALAIFIGLFLAFVLFCMFLCFREHVDWYPANTLPSNEELTEDFKLDIDLRTGTVRTGFFRGLMLEEVKYLLYSTNVKVSKAKDKDGSDVYKWSFEERTTFTAYVKPSRTDGLSLDTCEPGDGTLLWEPIPDDIGIEMLLLWRMRCVALIQLPHERHPIWPNKPSMVIHEKVFSPHSVRYPCALLLHQYVIPSVLRPDRRTTVLSEDGISILVEEYTLTRSHLAVFYDNALARTEYDDGISFKYFVRNDPEQIFRGSIEYVSMKKLGSPHTSRYKPFNVSDSVLHERSRVVGE